MIPKEKAKELVDKYYDKMFDLRDGHNSSEVYQAAKKCALIAVDEILSIDILIDEDTWVSKTSYLEFWKEVKKELEKL